MFGTISNAWALDRQASFLLHTPHLSFTGERPRDELPCARSLFSRLRIRTRLCLQFAGRNRHDWRRLMYVSPSQIWTSKNAVLSIPRSNRLEAHESCSRGAKKAKDDEE